MAESEEELESLDESERDSSSSSLSAIRVVSLAYLRLITRPESMRLSEVNDSMCRNTN